MGSSREINTISRRSFISLAGGAAGVAALAVMGVPTGWTMNRPKVDVAGITFNESSTDVLVIGSGMAGLFATVKAHDAGAAVMLVSKGRLGSSGQTPFAKGIFAFDPNNADISLDEFVDQVSRSALGTNNRAYTRQMAEHSLARVEELREWGFFDSALYNKCFSSPIKQRKITLHERLVITHLLKENNRIAGAAGFNVDSGQAHIFLAKSVILCTGAGGFKPNGFPICDLTHDGTVMAYKIGARVTGKEWNDGHPGKAEHPAACFNGWGDMFERKPAITGVEIRHDLGIDLNYRAYVTGGPIKMGPPDLHQGDVPRGGPYRPQEFVRGHPGKDHKSPPGGKPHDKSGAPPGMGGTTVGGSSAGMAIHKSEGVVPINDQCESDIAGLYAAGDALGSYMAGAIYTQIGSSLAGSAVQGAIAGEAAAHYSKDVSFQIISKAKSRKIRKEMFAPLKREAGYSPAWVTQTLQGIMIPNFILYIKKEKLLRGALAYIEELRDHHMEMLTAADFHELRLAHETSNMIVSAEMKLRASIMRKESRCSHFRLDYPDLDDKNWRAWINIYKGSDGSMQLEKQPFDSWPG